MGASKTQFYAGNGTGRDTYIYNNNGGFYPEKDAIRVDEIGSFVTSKQRHSSDLPKIHSKSIGYTNNGGGRDTYISSSSGGLKQIYQPA